MEYSPSNFFKSDIHFEIDRNFINNNDNIDKIQIAKIVMMLLTFASNLKNILHKIFVSITIFEYNIKHFKFLYDNFRFIDVVIHKLETFIVESKDPEKKQYFELVKNIYNLQDNPYKIFLNNMSPYYYKKILLDQLTEYSNINKNIMITKFLLDNSIELHNNAANYNYHNNERNNNERHNRQLQQSRARRQNRLQAAEQVVQAEQEIIKETGYPLRNRIHKKLRNSRR